MHFGTHAILVSDSSFIFEVFLAGNPCSFDEVEGGPAFMIWIVFDCYIVIFKTRPIYYLVLKLCQREGSYRFLLVVDDDFLGGSVLIYLDKLGAKLRVVITTSRHSLVYSLFVVVKRLWRFFRDHWTVNIVDNNLILPVLLPLIKDLLLLRHIFLPFLIGEYLVLPFEEEIAKTHLQSALGVEHFDIDVECFWMVPDLNYFMGVGVLIKGDGSFAQIILVLIFEDEI